MKIGYDLAQASFTRTGGGWYAQSLLEAMTESGSAHEFVAYHSFAHWMNPASSHLPFVPTRRVHDPDQSLAPDAVMQRWAHTMQSGEFPGHPDLVHSTSFQSPRVTGAPLVVTIFDLSFWAVPNFTTDRIRLDCQKGVLDALSHAKGLIFISDHARREFDSFLPQFRRKSKILTSVTPLASRWPVAEHPTETMGNYWLFVGSQEPRKNLVGLLDGYETYVQNHPSPRPLCLAGSGGWKNESWQARLVALERRGLLRQLGYVSEDAMPELYRDAAALIFPSWYEGFGLPVLEAMSQGCPVICSDRTSIPEVGGDAPFYVDPSQPKQIANALRRLEQEPALWRHLGAKGLKQAAKFSWSKTAAQTLAFYARVLVEYRDRSAEISA